MNPNTSPNADDYLTLPIRNNKILCVDDDEFILFYLEQILGDDYQTYLTTCAKEGLKLLEYNQDIAVAICDCEMPSMNGIEFLQQAGLIVPRATQLLHTGCSQLDLRTRAFNETHVYRVLEKPVPREVLKYLVAEACAFFKSG